MKKLAKLLSLVLALGMLGSLCAPALAEETTLEVWYALSGTSGEAFLSIVDDFNAQNPDVKVVTSYSGGYTDTATKITSALASNPGRADRRSGHLHRRLRQLLRR
mgnify:CR=1 FL=1